VPDNGSTLLEVLREHLGLRSLKDGCSPQGQCGCCTVWVDGSPRVACVTPVRRLEGPSGSGTGTNVRFVALIPRAEGRIGEASARGGEMGSLSVAAMKRGGS